jgi:hypothetical protein
MKLKRKSIVLMPDYLLVKLPIVKRVSDFGIIKGDSLIKEEAEGVIPFEILESTDTIFKSGDLVLIKQDYTNGVGIVLFDLERENDNTANALIIESYAVLCKVLDS